MASSASSGSRTKARPRRPRYGSETPRIWTQPLRPLTPETSLGFAVIEFAADVLFFELLPWQKWLLIHALELRPDGSLRFRNVVVLVSRQNGKSTLSQVLSLWWLFVCGVRLVIGTAQDLDVAEEIWQGAVDLVLETDDEDEPFRPEMASLVKKVVQVNGKKSLDLTTGERYKIKAANRRAGRGLSGDRIILDELREHQSWNAWGAITKTTMARPGAQIWCFSNAGDITSVVLRHLRRLAHIPLGDPDGIAASAEVEGFAAAPTDEHLDELEGLDFEPEDDDLAIFEWSAPPRCDVWDREAWAQANPSMGYTITEATIASAARTDPEWVFRTEVLCQWSEGVLVGPFSAGAWEGCAAAAVDGKLPPGEQIVPGSRVVEWKGTEVPSGCGSFFDAVRDHDVRHTSQPVLNLPATTAVTRPLEKGTWVWDSRRSAHEVAALWGATGAFWFLSKPTPAKPRPPSLPEVVVAPEPVGGIATAGF